MRKRPFGKTGWTPARLGSLSGKTYLITGANAGAGFEATKILLRKGASVVMLNRNSEKSAQAIGELHAELGPDADVTFVKLDLARLASVRAAAEVILQRVSTIDALVCNAAIAQMASRQLTADGFESQMGTNHYGHFLLINLLFARIAASRGRIVVVGSEGYKMGLRTIKFDDLDWERGYEPNAAYSQSKLAQMMTGYELQRRVAAAGAGVRVYVCHPGASKTSLIGADTPLLTRLSWRLLTLSPLVQSAERGAYPEVMCATEEALDERAYYGPTGRMNWVGPVGACALEPHALDEAVAARLWGVSEAATGQPFEVATAGSETNAPARS